EAPGRAAVAEARLLDAAEDSVELGVGNVEREVVTFERRIVIEQKRQRLVHPHRREVALGRAEPQAEHARKDPGRRHLVARRHDGVVQGDGHGTSTRCNSHTRYVVTALALSRNSRTRKLVASSVCPVTGTSQYSARGKHSSR